uniref:Uncharacterized protein n=1 Tax=Rhizophagus irregularis (strain DAOM 181602 / DAOM 197198 / MUCL 43194) TaxID=747089 RepID=U9TUT1_RHIID
MDGKVNKKTYYYFSYVIESRFSTGILPIGYHSTVLPTTSIDELTRSYNNQLHMDEDINDEFDIKIENNLKIVNLIMQKQ